MRVKIVFGLLLSLVVAFGALVIGRGRTPHRAPAAPVTSAAGSAQPAAGSASAAGSGLPAASASGAPADAGPVRLMDRPLRVIALGWDLAAAGVIANGGLEPSPESEFHAVGVDTRFAVTDTMSGVEGALARGGADKDGADVAIVPFSGFVASYERLRALSPEAFFVVGWSRGREALISAKDALPAPSDKAESKTAQVAMVGAPGEPATFLGLFALDAEGIPPSSVRLVAPGGRGDDPPLAAVDRDAIPADSARRNILVTTADASRLIPFVAIAQRGLLEKNGRALSAWARAWLEGTKRLESAAADAARQIATTQGAPEPIVLLKRLGEVASASLNDNVRVVGLSGRGALTLEVLFQRSWQIWRSAGLLATPAPEVAPVTTTVIASLARSFPSLIGPTVPPKAGAASAASSAAAKARGNADALRAMITYRQPEGKLDDAALLASAGFFADVFARSALRVAVIRAGGVDGPATKHLVDEAQERFDVPAARLVAAKKAAPKAAAAIEILATP